VPLRFLLACWLLLPIALAPRLEARSCEISSSDRQWIAAAIEIWGSAAQALERTIDTMPWTILYDAQCVVHLNPRSGRARTAGGQVAVTFGGKPVPVRSVAYRREFSLPSGQELSSDPAAFASLAEGGGAFFVMALPSVWRKDPSSMPEDIESFASGVLAHEMTHTIHLEAVMKALADVKRRFPTMPKQIDDDYLQVVFAEDLTYVADYDREIALYLRAVEESDAAAARALAREALAASDQRRARHFQGGHGYFAEVEPLFLNMEGVASWAAYTVVGGGAAPMVFSGSFWSQQQGLLLFLLLDRFDPTWKNRVFAEQVPDPFAMLRAVL
jgi:hypothetical protein